MTLTRLTCRHSYPLITLSTRAQVESQRASTNFLDAVRHIVAREGFTGLYAGLDSALFGISVTNFVYYYWYEWTRAAFMRAALRSGRAARTLSTLESMLAGALAGSATVLLTNPIWVINTRMTTRKRNHAMDGEMGKGSAGVVGGEEHAEVGSGKHRSTVGTLMALLKEEGPRALFAGVVPALVLVINPILQYTIFEQLKNFLAGRRRITPMIAFVLGALGKLFATTVTYPYITVKSRMHVAGGQEKRDGVRESMRRILRDEGWAGFYKGKSAQNSPSYMIILTEHRYRTKGFSKCPDCCLFIRFQGCAICTDYPASKAWHAEEMSAGGLVISTSILQHWYGVGYHAACRQRAISYLSDYIITKLSLYMCFPDKMLRLG